MLLLGQRHCFLKQMLNLVLARKCVFGVFILVKVVFIQAAVESVPLSPPLVRRTVRYLNCTEEN